MAKKKLFAEEPQLSIYNNLKPAQFKKLKDYPYKRMFHVGQVEKMDNKEIQRHILSSEIAGAFNWYNVNTNNKQQKQFVINYLKEQKESKELINIVRRCEDYHFCVLGSVARMISLQTDIEHVAWKKSASFFEQKLKELIQYSKTLPEPEKKERPKINIQAVTAAKIERLTDIFSDELDKQLEKNKFNKSRMKKLFNEHKVKKRIMNKIKLNFDNPDMIEVIDEYLAYI